jgi:pyridoxamine 5'-phosphate oxidase
MEDKMNREEIFNFLNRNPVFYLATLEGTQPRVRAMLLYRADAEGIVFHTGTHKEMHGQIQANPAVELCFYNPDERIQIRVSGKAYLDGDFQLKKEMVEKHDFLKPLIAKAGFEALAVYRIKEGVALLWSLADIGAPKCFVQL